MKPKHEKSLKQQLEDDYAEARKKVEQEPYLWNTYDDMNFPTLDWRLWNSISNLDITLCYVRDFLKKARRKRKRTVVPSILKVEALIGESLEFIDSQYWKTKRFLDMTTDHEKLKNALECLKEAYSQYETVYMDVSLNLEVPASSKAKQLGWIVIAPTILSHLRNAIYGLEQFLETHK